MAGPEEADCLDALGSGARHAHASGNGADDALGFSHGASVAMVVLSDVVFHGGGQPLSVLEYGGAIEEEGHGKSTSAGNEVKLSPNTAKS